MKLLDKRTDSSKYNVGPLVLQILAPSTVESCAQVQ